MLFHNTKIETHVGITIIVKIVLIEFPFLRNPFPMDIDDVVEK